MVLVDLMEAGEKLSRLMDMLDSGAASEIVLTRNGTPVAKLVAIERQRTTPRKLGLRNGHYRSMTLEDLNASDAAIASLFSGEDG